MTEAAFQAGGVIPDVVDHVGDVKLKVTYPAGTVAFGNTMTPTQVHSPPTVSFDSAPNEYFTLVMTDPDAPSRANPKFREWHHWVVANIPGHDVAKGKTLSAYVGSGPPKGTGLHRYCFLLYKQPSGPIEFHEPIRGKNGDGRGKWSAKAFAAKYHLGDPVGGCFFQAEWDEYSDKVFDP
eukprot:tig00021127_g18692.t1